MSATGTWTLTMSTPMGAQKGTLTLTEAGGVLTGTMTGPDGAAIDVKDGTANGAKLSWKLDAKKPFPMTMHFDVEIDGDNLSGKFRPGMFPSSSVTGVRA